MTKGPKRPWLAALLAFFFGGPGFSYLGLRQGIIATIVYIPAVILVINLPSRPSPNIDPEAVGLYLLQAVSSGLAFLSCKRINAEAAKAVAREECIAVRTSKVHRDCSSEIRDIGMQVTVLSGVTLFVGLMAFANTNPPMGEMGHSMHDSTMVMVPMSLWGVATGIGLMRAWRWAWISMLVFGGLLVTPCTLIMVGFSLMPGEDMVWRALFVLLSLVPAAIGVRWFRFFLRSNVKSYFGISRKADSR